MIRLDLCGAVFALALSPALALAQDVPDAITLESNGVHLCEKLYDDAQIRVSRCTFPPGAVQGPHSHPGYITYVLTPGKSESRSDKGLRQREYTADQVILNPPTVWHEYKNTGDTTIRLLVIEKKYEPIPPK